MRKLATLKRLFDDRALYCQLIVTRRCNLACGYCNEFDKVSQPVAYDTLIERMNHLVHTLGVTIMDFLGGEPLLHPRIADLVGHAYEQGCWTNIITNGFLLSDELVDKLNLAGLDSMAVSIDRIHPTDFTHKGLIPLRKKLARLRARARFKVEVNIVLCEETLDEFEDVVEEIKKLGLPVRCSVRHYQGRMELSHALVEKFEWFQQHFRHWRIAPLLDLHRGRLAGRAANWKCSGGFKYLYVDEFGIVRACSQVHLAERIEVTDMTLAKLKTNDCHKNCEKECGVSCVIQTSLITQKPIRYGLRCAQHVVASRLAPQTPVAAATQPLLQSPAR
jgi:MoaA/NifB/PqqE/SkfB family radical SAM enzyme